MHSSWKPLIERAYDALDPEYRQYLETSDAFFPDYDNMFNAFTLPKEQTRYILFGQDPYPRKASATGYAFIDGMVQDLFSDKGLSKAVNKATSLRNFMKMNLHAAGLISSQATQQEIAALNKDSFISTAPQLQQNLQKNGVMLLNTALIFSAKDKSRYHVKMWHPFMRQLLGDLEHSKTELILFGNISKQIERFDHGLRCHYMPHPYNVSFICDKKAHELFGPMEILKKL
ncbi:MAG: uracil-DNA glycosylase [Campylobacterota bacterium]